MKFKLYIICILLINVNICYGKWSLFLSVRAIKNSSILEDIDSHMPSGHAYSDSDKVTWAHETTHGINSAIRLKFPTTDGYYLLNNTIFLLNTPPITLTYVSCKVPRNIRGRIYNLYLVEQLRWWDNPLYLIDECVCYLNGALVGEQYKLTSRSIYSFENCMEMFEYVLVMRKLSGDFPDRKALDELIEELYDRIADFATRNKISSTASKKLLRIHKICKK